MKFHLRIAAAVISTATVLAAADTTVTKSGGGLTVHEWGTFTSVAGEDGSAIDWDVLGGRNDLPGFVFNRGFPCFKFRLTGTVRMETPVLYFYSPRKLDAHVRVAFPKGLITEWYPQADYQIDQGNGASAYRLPPNMNGIDTSMRSVTGGIEWANVKIEPNTAPKLLHEGAASHYYAARETDAAPISVGDQHEKFLFYRGVGRFPIPLAARISAGKVVVTNAGPDPVPMTMLFENRGGRIGYRNAGAVAESVMFDPPALEGSLPQLYADLENALVAQGLFRKEAHAMVETWKDSWFEEGSRIIYIVPSRTVDAVLPLQVDPLPADTVRVFVGRIELMTPETKRAVASAALANDRSVLERYGRFLDPILKRLALENPAKASQFEECRSRVLQFFFGESCRY